MNYSEVINYIHEKEKLGSVFGLEAINELLFRLGNPEKEIKAIHIAGTNGKGSIMSFVEESLICAGYKVGRYISPTIYDYRERWMLNHVWATEEEVSSIISEVADKVSEMIEDGYNSPTAFEIETAAAFLFFKKWQVDYMLIECGMGGRLDATNVLDDAINILASISMDHMKVLGDNVIDITREKLGIVRKGSVLITYPQTEEVMQEIRSYALENDVRLIEADSSLLDINDEDIYGSEFIYKGEDYRINIGGRYQVLNAITAVEALGYILKCGDEVGSSEVCSSEIDASNKKSEDDLTLSFIKEGLRNTSWDARFEVVNDDPVVIVDGAHNEDAWYKLRESIETHFTNKKVIFIIGVLADKEYDKMVRILGPLAQVVYTVQTDSPRALSKEVLAECFESVGVKAVPFSGIEEALSVALDEDGAIDSVKRDGVIDSVKRDGDFDSVNRDGVVNYINGDGVVDSVTEFEQVDSVMTDCGAGTIYTQSDTITNSYGQNDGINTGYNTKKVIVVCGSLTVTGRAIKYFSKEPEYAKN